MHAHEAWVLVASAAFVAAGGWLELAARRRRRLGFPWLFAFSALCLLANIAMLTVHRAGA